MGTQLSTYNLPWVHSNKTNDPEMRYLSILSQARRIAKDYFLHGHVQRDLPDQPQIASQTLFSIPWLSRDQNTLLIPLTTPKSNGTAELKMTIDLKKYGFTH